MFISYTINARRRQIFLKDGGYLKFFPQWPSKLKVIVTYKKQHQKISNHTRKIDWLLKDIIKINPNSDTDKMPPISILDKKNNNLVINDREDFEVKDCTKNILIFTYGSKDSNEPTRYGISFSEDFVEEISGPFFQYNDIFEAKVIAIWKAGEIIKKIKI